MILTLILFSSYSVALAFKIIQNFTKTTGLKLNIEKTQGMAVSSSCNNALLPSITWKNDLINVLGLKIGKLNPKIIWNDNLENLKRQNCPSRYTKKINHLPHRDSLTPYYEQSIRILTKYKITLEELQAGKIKPIYKRLSLTDYNWSDHDKIRWKLTFNDILPNYLKTFNYGIVWNLLPFSHELGKMCIVQAGSGFGCPPFCQMQRHQTNLESTKRYTYKRYPKTIYN